MEGARQVLAGRAPPVTPRYQSRAAVRAMMQSDDDDALMARYAAGDVAAARALIAIHAPRVVAHAARLLGDRSEAEDVAQEAMLKLWRIAPDWKPGTARVSTWLFRVTANLCTDRLRKPARRRAASLDEGVEFADPDAQSAEARLTETSRATALEAALGDLPDRQRQAVVLRHLEGLSNPEIAEVMDLSPRAVESLTARGKRALAARLAEWKDKIGWTDE